MVTVEYERFLSEDQKEALRQVNKNKMVLSFYEKWVSKGWSQEAALQETYDEILFHRDEYNVNDLKI